MAVTPQVYMVIGWNSGNEPEVVKLFYFVGNAEKYRDSIKDRYDAQIVVKMIEELIPNR